MLAQNMSHRWVSFHCIDKFQLSLLDNTNWMAVHYMMLMDKVEDTERRVLDLDMD